MVNHTFRKAAAQVGVGGLVFIVTGNRGLAKGAAGLTKRAYEHFSGTNDNEPPPADGNWHDDPTGRRGG